jgi:hypothetical protein
LENPFRFNGQGSSLSFNFSFSLAGPHVGHPQAEQYASLSASFILSQGGNPLPSPKQESFLSLTVSSSARPEVTAAANWTACSAAVQAALTKFQSL